MGKYYTLRNIDVVSATVVAVANRTQPPAPGRDAAAGDAGPAFAYTAWQFLNPSPQAGERFEYEEKLYVSVRHSDQPWSSKLMRYPVYAGRSYALVLRGEDIGLRELSQKTSGNSSVEILVSSPVIAPLSAEIDWYLGGIDPGKARRVGVTRGVRSGSAAYYQPDAGTLLFLTVPSNHADQHIYQPSELLLAQPYKAPATATSIDVLLQYDETGMPVYAFHPRSR
ncbi:hypothetical protein [Duganella sp. HH105]|uniref:hypothetical protein n=1 Tax=Duganella sp. HH105 TaxID=1781067 RepID=UPI000877D09A|nr:hypothetical protein [Duganella sp. HH105]OEZ62013.1 hypothetical protein DUGA6_16970 [Duganella sp. HH105]